MVEHTQTILRQKLTNCLSVFEHFVELVRKDYLRYVAEYSLFDPNIAIIYEKDNPYKHLALVCLYILICFSGHLC